jgi:hypothetical protein
MGFFKKIFGKATQFGLPGLIRGGSRALGGGGGGDNYQPGPNPADAAMGYLNQIPGAVQPYYQPFIESGRQAEGMTNPIYEQMSRSPGAFIEQLMQGYTPSRGYRFKQGEMERAMRNTAAHGGFVGTPYNQQQQAELTQGLLSEDMQQFLQNLLGAQQMGLGGQERRINRGYEASTGYGDILGSNLGAQAGLGYQGQAGQNQMNADIFGQRMANRTARRNAGLGFLGNLIGGGARMMGGGF